MSTEYIQVILPLPLEWEPCYCLGGDGIFDQVQKRPGVGYRVRVKFSGRRYIGVVSAVDVQPEPDISKIEAVEQTDTGLAAVSTKELEFWRFLADYYMCSIGEVYKAAYPLSKTLSEQIRVQGEERRERLLQKETLLWKGRIASLEKRLAAKEKAIAGRHRKDIAERLQSEKAALVKDLASAQARLRALSGSIFPDESASAPMPPIPLFDAIPEAEAAFKAGKPVLTNSQKRYEIYRKLAADCLSQGRSVLLLVPEAGLAKHLEAFFRESFGNLLKVYHSEETPAQRRRISDELRSGKPLIILSTRSGIFLPFPEAGLIIVEEEGSPFYKQGESAPRYNGRDAAVMLGRILGAKVLLGGSSPSLESLLNVSSGRYSLMEEPSKAKSEGEFTLIDSGAERRKNGFVGCLSRRLIALAGKGKTALLRGYEKEEEVCASIEKAFPGEGARFSIFTLPEASRQELSDYDCVALLSADALLRPGDFRSDERAFAFLYRLRRECRRLVVQSEMPQHQIYTLDKPDSLLPERRTFELPPYSRLVDVLVPDCSRFSNIAAGISRRLIQLGFKADDALLRDDGKWQVRVTLQRDASLAAKKNALREAVTAFCEEHKFRGRIAFDADPA